MEEKEGGSHDNEALTNEEENEGIEKIDSDQKRKRIGRCRLLATASGCTKGDKCKYAHPEQMKCPVCKELKAVKEFSRAQLLRWKSKPQCKECCESKEEDKEAEAKGVDEKKNKRKRKKRKTVEEQEDPTTEGEKEKKGSESKKPSAEGINQSNAQLGRCKALGSAKGCPNIGTCPFRHPLEEQCATCKKVKLISAFSNAQLKSKANPTCKDCVKAN